MTAVSDLKNRLPDMPDLSELDLPRMEKVGRAAGRSADESIDRLLGKSRNPIWPWIALGLSLAAIAGVIAAYMAWFRRTPVETATPETGWTPEPTAAGSWQAESTPVSELGTSPLDV
jgi:hypothetical protein